MEGRMGQGKWDREGPVNIVSRVGEGEGRACVWWRGVQSVLLPVGVAAAGWVLQFTHRPFWRSGRAEWIHEDWMIPH